MLLFLSLSGSPTSASGGHGAGTAVGAVHNEERQSLRMRVPRVFARKHLRRGREMVDMFLQRLPKVCQGVL